MIVRAYTARPVIIFLRSLHVPPQPVLEPLTRQKLEACSSFQIQQHVNLVEEITGGCWEKENRYDIVNANTGETLFFAKEDSDNWDRCCCNPQHQWTVNFQHANADGNFHEEFYPSLAVQRKGSYCTTPFKCLGVCVWMKVLVAE